MSDADAPVTAATTTPLLPAVPSITGNPVLDTAMRSLLLAIGGGAASILISVLAKYGVTDANLNAQLPTLIATFLTILATGLVGAWSVRTKKTAVSAVVEQSLLAAVSGTVPDAVKALASASQLETITKAGK